MLLNKVHCKYDYIFIISKYKHIFNMLNSMILFATYKNKSYLKILSSFNLQKMDMFYS